MSGQRTQRKAVGGSSWRGWLFALAAAVLLSGLIVTGSITPPPPTPVPTPTAIQVSTTRIFTVQQRDAALELVAFAPNQAAPLFRVAGVRRMLPAPDGATLYALTDDTLLALDAQTGAERWRADAPEVWRSLYEPVLFIDQATGQVAVLIQVSLDSPYVSDTEVLFVALYDPRDGHEVGRVPLGSVRQVRRVLLSADGRFLLQSYYNNTMRAVDLHERRDVLIAGVLPGLETLILSHDETLIYGFRSRDNRLTMDFIDPGTFQHNLERRVQLTTSFKLQPLWAYGPQQIALHLTSDDVLDGQRSQVWLIDPAAPTVPRVLPITGTLTALSFADADLYVAATTPAGSLLTRYAAAGAAEALPQRLEGQVNQLVVVDGPLPSAPPTQLASRLTAPQPLAELANSALPPQPLPTQPPNDAEIWLTTPGMSNSNGLVLRWRADQVDVVAHDVQITVPRPDRSLLGLGLAFSEKSNPPGTAVAPVQPREYPLTWLLDITTQERRDLALPPLSLADGCTSDPEGAQVACVDAWERRIWLIDVVSGATQQVPQAAADGIGLIRLLGWSRRYGLLGLGGNGVAQQVWRIDPLGASAPQSVVTASEVVFIAHSDRLLYLTLAQTSLHMLDLNTGQDRELVTGAGELTGLWALDPTGQQVAVAVEYPIGFEIIQIDLDTGTQRVLRRAAQVAPGSLAWATNGTALAFLEPVVEDGPRALWLLDPLGLVGYSVYPLEGTVMSMAPITPTTAAAVILDTEGYALITLGPGRQERTMLPVFQTPTIVLAR